MSEKLPFIKRSVFLGFTYMFRVHHFQSHSLHLRTSAAWILASMWMKRWVMSLKQLL